MKFHEVLGTTIVLLSMMAGSVHAVEQEIEWIRQFGTEFGDNVLDVVVDRWGNVIVAGATSGGMAADGRNCRPAQRPRNSYI